MVKLIDDRLSAAFPGVNFDYSQNIEDNINEALSGVKGSNSVKVFGPDLGIDERIANDIKTALDKVRGIAETAVYRSLGQPNLLITPDRRNAHVTASTSAMSPRWCRRRSAARP